jgi:hypothetical protein
MKKHLKSMVQFVLDTVHTVNVNEAICWEQTQERLDKIYQNALLLSQPPNIGMFVPAVCEGNVWRVLEEPERYKIWFNSNGKAIAFELGTNDLCQQYQQAQSKVIFSNWDINFQTKEIDGLIHESIGQIWFYKNGQVTINSILIHTLEDLVKFNLEMI